ncbi:MAG: hypothetical protein ACOY3Y_04755, partial [Acidobacteriota bacterium]
MAPRSLTESESESESDSVSVSPPGQLGAPAQSGSSQSNTPSASLSAPSLHSPGFTPSTSPHPRRAIVA